MSAWPLVGRNRDLSLLLAAVVARRGAVITGSAGVGKTTLAMECVRLAQERGMLVARATATHASRGLPFGALASFLPPDTGTDGLWREDHGQLLRRYAQTIVASADGKPLLVFVDDVHLLDNGSATLLHQLALTRTATVLVTVRSGEAAPDAIVALWKDGLAERVDIGVLDEAAIEEVLTAVLGGPIDIASLRQLIGRCRGNPMYLRELVIGALATGGLNDDSGIWCLRGTLRPSARLVELVALRLGDLSGPERTVLELLALGEPLGHRVLAQLANAASIQSLERKGLISSRVERRRVQVWLAHPIYGEVVRVGVGPLRESDLARSIAQVIEAAGARRREDTLLLASFHLIGGGGSVEILLSGAIAARARQDHALTERLARAAIDEGGGFDARLMAAEAAHFQGRPDQAERELGVLAAEATNDAERARVALLRFDNAFFLHGSADFGLLDNASDAVVDHFWRDELLTRRLMVMAYSVGPRATIEAGATLLERPRQQPLTAVYTVLCNSLLRSGRLGEALALVTPPPGARAIPATDDPWDQWILLIVRVDALVRWGRFVEAEDLLTRAYDQVAEQPAAEARAYVAGWFAVLHLEQGRPLSAFRRASESYSLFQMLGRTLQSRWPYIAAARALALAWRPDKAAEILAIHDALGLPPVLLNETDLIEARAWTVLAAGDLPGARLLLESAVELGEETGDLIGVTNALHGLARLGRAHQVAGRLAELATQVDGSLVAARAAFANALVARSSAGLERVAGDFEDMGAILYAAEARAEAAAILRRSGDVRRAAAAEQKAARLLARCEGAATALVRITARVRLTPGELEIALHAAAGQSNKQIAGGVHLSVRTVESHLQRAYEKLGVSGRHQLADALHDKPRVERPTRS